MSREEEIKQASVNSNDGYGDDIISFQVGAKWADQHPSEETILKVLELARAISTERLLNGKSLPNDNERIAYIKAHFNDNEK